MNTPPNNIEMERQTLCCCLIDPDAYYTIHHILKPKMFYDRRNVMVYTAMLTLFQSGEPIDILTVRDQLEKEKKLHLAGNDTYIAGLSSEVATSTHVVYYAEQVREYAVRRGALIIAQNIENAVNEGKQSEEILNIALTGIGRAKESSNSEMLVVSNIVRSVVDLAIERKQMISSGNVNLPQTGIAKLDRYNGFFESGLLYIIGARTSVGKSDFMLNLCYNIARRFPVGIISAEMTVNSLVMRLMSLHTGLDRFNLRAGFAKDEEYEELKARANLGDRDKNIIIDFKRKPGAMYIKARAMAMKSHHDIKVLFIDHLHELKKGNEFGSDSSNWVALVKDLRDMADDITLPIVLLTQLNRAAMQTSGVPQLHHLREAGEEHADVVWLLHRENYDKTHNKDGSRITEDVMNVSIKKMRDGATTNIQLYYNLTNGLIRESEDNINSIVSKYNDAMPF